MAIFVDSNVLLDVLNEPGEWTQWSAAALAAAANRAPLVINAIVYAEISVGFSTIEALEAALPRNLLHREPISENAAFLAGKAFLAYRRRGGTRTSPLPDFLIGAHAATAGHTLLTRDSNRYRTYFPPLPLIAPT
jgi:predicted nucleic acid-binding protein